MAHNSVLLKGLQDTIEHISITLEDSVKSLAYAFQQNLNDTIPQNSEKFNQSLRSIIDNKLNDYKYCSGAGFASHVQHAKDQNDYWLLEWSFKKSSDLSPSYLNLDQATQQRLDFRTFDWFSESQSSDSTYIHGPYVDYICNTSYTLTAAHPIFINNTFIGVAVVDLLVSQLEECLSEYIKQMKHELLITNADGRVILSNNTKMRAGCLIKKTPTINYEILDHGFFHILYKN